MVRRSWTNTTRVDDEAARFSGRKEKCVVVLSDWGFRMMKKEKVDRRTAVEALERLSSSKTVDAISERHTLKLRIAELDLKEEIWWHQRSKVQWLKEGDQNTNFFHSVASQRRRSNHIEQLFESTGHILRGEELKLQIVSFYTDLYSSSNS